MSGISSPLHFLPPISPSRAPSPTMSPGGRRGRTVGGSEEAYLRDLSPDTTLRAFTEKPVPYDTTRDEYKMFACIDSLTPAERDLGARVAKAAQRLKTWCREIEQWGWPGGFEQPSEECREKRRRSLELRIREHVKDSVAMETIGPLEYWGSLLSVEVAAHDARLDEMGEELLTLDVEELKEHVLNIHGPNRSRPSSSGYEASRHNYTPMDDFSFLITQTLLSALPHHCQLKDRLNTWTARVSILREAPRYLNDLQTAQRAMKLGWDAIEPPTDTSDAAFDKWKEAVDTISGVLQGKVGDLGQRLDRMLDTLEGREDCLPDDWIDTFEGVEGDFGRWTNESRRKVIEFDVRRKTEQPKLRADGPIVSEQALPIHSDHLDMAEQGHLPVMSEGSRPIEQAESTKDNHARPPSVTASKQAVSEPSSRHFDSSLDGTAQDVSPEPDTDLNDDFVFEEGDTVVHNEVEQQEDSFSSTYDIVHVRPKSGSFSESPVVVTTEETRDTERFMDRPQTPRSRHGSVGSISSNISFSSSPPSVVEESPSVRTTTNRQAKTPKPELNAAMGKRRHLKIYKDVSSNNIPPWPPTQFSKQLSPNSNEDLERKISDILTTIPAHIRLTTGKGEEVKPAHGGLTNKSSKGYLRAARSMNGLKSPELTLSPAKQDFESTNAASGRKSAVAMRGDNDIKLYHLTQPGKDKPQKLYIRRVGENGERLMVRVGGGWSDLGEFLRHYAETHGRRTASEGKFEILGLEVKTAEGSPRPESAMSKRDRRFSGGHVASPNVTPKKSNGLGISVDEAAPPVPSLTNTPVGANGEASAPSTGSSRHSWTGNEVGLAGPKTKKLDLSGDKLEWIEGMMKQARTVSGNMSGPKSDQTAHHREGADSRSDSRAGGRRPDFGELGKVGSTKRIFMRGNGFSDQ